MVITQKITLDLAQRDPPRRIAVKQGDANSRCVEITLLSNSVSWPVPEGTTAAVRYCKADGKAGLYDTLPDGTTPAVTYNGNVLTVNLAPQMLAIGPNRGGSPAEVYADVLLINGDSLLATFDFILEVWRNPVSGSTLESENYYKVVSLEQINAALAATVRSVNGITPDADGNVTIPTSGGGSGGSGTPGADGGYYTPSVTQPDASTMRVTYTPSDSSMPAVAVRDITLPAGPAGPKGDTGDTGPQGPAGQNGTTPQRGIDYWTASDQQSVVADVLAALPTWEGGSY